MNITPASAACPLQAVVMRELTGEMMNKESVMKIDNDKPGEGRRFSGHVQMTTDSALAMGDRALVDMFGHSAKEIRAELNKMKAAGQEYLHTEGCDNFDEVTGKCLGHSYA